MSLLTYGLLEQTTTQRKHKTSGQKKRHETNVRQTLHGKIQTQMRTKKALPWTELQLECTRHVENSAKHTNL